MISLKSSKHEASGELLKTRIPPPQLKYIAAEPSFLQVSEKMLACTDLPRGKSPALEEFLSLPGARSPGSWLM